MDQGFINYTVEAYHNLGDTLGLWCGNIHNTEGKDIQATAGVFAITTEGAYQWGTDLPQSTMDPGQDPTVLWGMPDMIANCQTEQSNLPKNTNALDETIYKDSDGELTSK